VVVVGGEGRGAVSVAGGLAGCSAAVEHY